MLTCHTNYHRPISRDLRALNRLFFNSFGPVSQPLGWPRVNVVESEAALDLSVDVPGFRPDDIGVSLHQGVLTIEGNTPKEESAEEGAVVFSERRRRSFKRSFELTADIDPDAVVASVKDGVLRITLPKAESSKARTIAVTGG